MQRRDFLRVAGAASLMPRALLSAAVTPGATVLYDDGAAVLADVRPDRANRTALWVRKGDLPRINKFEVKPQGACREDICVPIPKDMTRGGYFNLTAFARKIGEPVVADVDERVWSFGEIQLLRMGSLNSRVAPDFTVPDRRGRPVHLSDFRGKKVLLVTWASW
jgi:hypothetical protein